MTQAETLARNTRLGIALKLVQMTKSGRLSQYVEKLSEPYQWLTENGWKENHEATFIEIES
jgi:hypothetical protein